MSQIDLGKLLGYTRVAVSKMERGITRLDISDLERIAAA
ncbi:MAG: XRE family transcriptional regulator, partial [Dehalococcoidia bacterium]